MTNKPSPSELGENIANTSEIEATKTTATSTAEDADVLLIKECEAWNSNANEIVLSDMSESYYIVGASEISDTVFTNYSVVILASTQPEQVYSNLADRQSDIADFVSNGGTFVAHASEEGWPCRAYGDYNYLPGDINIVDEYTDEATIVDTEHPIVENVASSDLSNYETTLAYFENVPSDGTTIVRNSETGPTCVEYPHGDGTVIANAHVAEWAWVEASYYAGVQTQTYLENEITYAIDDGDSSINASVATVHFIPGAEENTSNGGNPLNSALMQVFKENDSIDVPLSGEFNLHPVLDSWYYGDMKDEIAETLEEATDAETGKYRDAFGNDPYRNYRVKHEIEVSFEASGGTINPDTVGITFNGPLQGDQNDVTGVNKEENPYSVLVENQINLLPLDDWFDNDQRRRANQEPQYYTYEQDFELDGTEGVRVLSITGGYVGFADAITQKSSNDLDEFLTEIFNWDGKLEQLAAGAAGVVSASERLNKLLEIVQVVPRTWSFIEFIVLADGRRYTRVWDAPPYPSMFTYMDGDRKTMDKMPYQAQERANPWLLGFFARAIAEGTPYQGSFREYIDFITDPDILAGEMEDEYERMVDIFQPDYDVAASEVLPNLPRETLGYNPTDGPDVTSPSKPFGDTPDLSNTTKFNGSDFQELGPDQ